MNHSPANPVKNISAGRFALLLAALVFIPFWNVLLGVDTFAAGDFGLFSYPVAYFHRQCFWRGEMPWWNPLSCCGQPFLAQFNTLALYPPSLIYLVLPLSWSLPFFCLLHVFFGGMGMYFLATRWTGSRAGGALAGVAFAFNGLTLNLLLWPSHTAAFAWTPWVIFLTAQGWQAGGRALALAALAAAMQVLAGGPEEILFTWLILATVAIIGCAKKEGPPLPVLARRFLLTGGLAAALAAPLLLPFADFALYGNRGTGFGASDWAMPTWGWANFLAPEFRMIHSTGRAMQPGQYWTSSYYAGVGILFLTAMALWRRRTWRVWLPGAMVATALVLALGDQGFVFQWLRRLLPVVGFFRFPIKFTLIVSTLLPLLAAHGLSQYENEPAHPQPFRRAEWACVAAIVFLTGAILGMAWHDPSSTWMATRNNIVSRLALLAAFLAALVFFVTRPERRRKSLLALILICWLGLISAVPWQNPAISPSVFQPNLGQLAARLNPAPEAGQSRLMMSSEAARRLYYWPAGDLKTAYLLDRSVFLSDCNLLDGLPKVDGFFSQYLRETDRVLRLLEENSAPEKAGTLEALKNFLGVSQTMAPGKNYDWQPHADYLPVISAGQSPVFADDQAAFDAIGQTNINYANVVYLPPEARSQVTATREPAARISGKKFSDNKVILQVETPKPAMVVISQSYYHDWRATVDGRPVPLWRANYAFQSLEVPAGHHEIAVTYQDNLFWIGTVVTLVSGFVCWRLWRAERL